MATTSNTTPPLSKVAALRRVIEEGNAGTQDELREELLKLGLDLNQSTISRTLKRLGAVRGTDDQGRTVYRLPDEAFLPPPAQASMSDMVTNIAHNGHMIVINTSPGSASLIARRIDHAGREGELPILGTIAGDDTIFVAPASSVGMEKTVAGIRAALVD